MVPQALLVVFNLCRWRHIWFLLLLLKVDVWRWFFKFPSLQDAFESLYKTRRLDVKTFRNARPAVVCRLCLVSLSSIWLEDLNIGYVQRSEGFFSLKWFPGSAFASISHLSSLWPRSRTNTSLFPGGQSFPERLTLSTSGGSDTRLMAQANLHCHLWFGNF